MTLQGFLVFAAVDEIFVKKSGLNSISRRSATTLNKKSSPIGLDFLSAGITCF
ncbi:MAG: hypothetical protein HPY70_14145 [Firmicutes bacterium]|nr:hypothetical protein [Bacillota bacterium]